MTNGASAPTADPRPEDVWSAFQCGRNPRVPITFACDEQVWLRVSGHSFGRFYADPRVHLQAQLEGRRWFAERVPGDQAGVPERWPVVVQLWMEEDEFFGCEVVYQEDDYAWARPLPLARDDLLRHLSDLDPEARVRQGRAFRMYEALRDLAAGRSWAGRPVEVMPPGRSTHGIFTKAAEVRGPAQLCLDLCEAPDFAAALLGLVTEKTIRRIAAWRRLTGDAAALPTDDGFHLADDSLQLISAAMYERFVLPCHERLYRAMTTGPRRLHLCGHAAQHYRVLRQRLGVSALDGPGPFVDHGRWLADLGPGFSLSAQTDHTVLEQGDLDAIEAMMARLLTPGTRQPGRFQIMGFLTRHTPLAHVEACYQAGLRHGRIELN
jgi:hypothetical protein